MGELEAIGDAVTGGLIARALEPQAGEAGPDGHTHETNCLNCGAPLTGVYCAACGQKAHIHRSVRAFFGDFIQGLFNFEGKIWRTLPMLAWRPGELTRRYIAGERARFISPAALYLFTVFIMFAVLNLTGTLGSGTTTRLQNPLKLDLAEEQAALVKLEAQRKTAGAGGQDLADLDRKIARHKEDIAETQKILSGRAFASAEMDDDTPSWVRPMIENVMQNPEAVSMDSGLGVEVQLATDSDLGAVPVAAVPLQPALQHLRPRRLHHLFAGIHDDARRGRWVAGCGRHGEPCEPALLRTAVPHVPAPQGRVSAGALQRAGANGGIADLRLRCRYFVLCRDGRTGGDVSPVRRRLRARTGRGMSRSWPRLPAH